MHYSFSIINKYHGDLAILITEIDRNDGVALAVAGG